MRPGPEDGGVHPRRRPADGARPPGHRPQALEERLGEQGRGRRFRGLPQVQPRLRRHRQHPLRAHRLAGHGDRGEQRGGGSGRLLVEGRGELLLVRLHGRRPELHLPRGEGAARRPKQRHGALLRRLGQDGAGDVSRHALPRPSVPHAGRALPPRHQGVVLLRPPLPDEAGARRVALRRVQPRLRPVAGVRVPAPPAVPRLLRVHARGAPAARPRGHVEPLRHLPLRLRGRAVAEGQLLVIIAISINSY